MAHVFRVERTWRERGETKRQIRYGINRMSVRSVDARVETLLRRLRVLVLVAGFGLTGGLMPARALAGSQPVTADRPQVVSFSATSGNYGVSFRSSNGAIVVKPRSKQATLTIRELPGAKKLDLLYSVTSVRHSGSTYVLKGRSSWASFTISIDLPSATPGLLHFKLALALRKVPPEPQRGVPDVQLTHAPAASLKEYAPAPPIAGSSVLFSSPSLGSSMLYLADLTSLGPYFDRTRSGATQPNFAYPKAGDKGSLVGATGDGYFGYLVPPSSLDTLPHGKSTPVVDSYLYLVPNIPGDETAMADTYLKTLGAVYAALPKPSLPPADWKSLAAKQAKDLADPANWVTVNGTRFLRSYVSDTRSDPELITQAGVLAGVKAYESRFQQSLPLDTALEDALPAFYDPEFHTITNHVGHSPDASDESWYFVDNMISLLQSAQLGSAIAKTLLLDSTPGVMALAHNNNYEFPQNFFYRDFKGQGTGLQPDVAGGYAWLMLGLYDLTKKNRYLDEAKAAIAHVVGKGFDLSYETFMTAYAAAAAQRLYKMTGEAAYRGYALLALANLFHATRLWDCTYGFCQKGSGYHTYFGLNPLPWSDYIAMLEQYEAWLGLRDYLRYAQNEPAYVTDLVNGFVTYSALTMRYALPPLLPTGAATGTPAEYPNVPKNELGWSIPLEDLREGEATSGVIGQEIYGAGGPFVFGAYGS